MLKAIRRGDTVITSGGLIGKVTKVEENEIELEIAAGTRVRVVKSMLSEVRPHCLALSAGLGEEKLELLIHRRQPLVDQRIGPLDPFHATPEG